MKNPIIDGQYADPEARVYNGKVYIYVTRSLPFEEQHNLDLIVSEDLIYFTLPKGYDTVLSDDGINISKGQKQLITIARAMLSDASMLILDEATSNVDSRIEIQIQDALSSLMKGRTCFVIAHRLSTIKNADNIIVIDGGRIIEQGNHNELISLGGFYSKLYNSQFD